jgi:hypothetical protein
MKRRVLFALTILAAALPAMAAPTCPAPQVAQGSNCTLLVTLGWASAGQGTQSIIQTYVPPTASGPVTWTLTTIKSSLGNTYTGFMGITVQGFSPGPGIPITVSTFPQEVLSPGQYDFFRVAQVCWDSTCTAPAPSGPVAIMFSAQFLISASNPADVAAAVTTLTIQFLNNNQVTFEETETAQLAGPNVSYIPGISIGGTPAARYVNNNVGGVTAPFDAISITNQSNAPITGTVTLVNADGSVVGPVNIPAIPVNGAAGYLVIGRTPGDALGLFPSSTVLPMLNDGNLHGTMIVNMSGPNIVLAQEYNGNAMLNLLVSH